MSLRAYLAKRDFRVTPEPRGMPTWLTSQSRFVVQQHHASHPHYDFRLEIEGVLKSWAVPKGPSVNPLVRRQGIQTEDHPLSYIDFEGRIPAGQYGAGTVIVWDQGKFQAKPGQTAGAAHHEGHIVVILQGQRLRGGWLLQRTTGIGLRSQWLLIKIRDEFASTEVVTSRYNTSVISGKTNDQF